MGMHVQRPWAANLCGLLRSRVLPRPANSDGFVYLYFCICAHLTLRVCERSWAWSCAAWRTAATSMKPVPTEQPLA